MEQKEFWNKQALDFPRYDKNSDDFQQSVINILKQDNILSSNSTLLDIGCGTGMYTIPLAKEVKKVLALDISSNMLDLLKEDAWSNNVSHVIDTKVSDWSKFKSREKYDVIFASLPAAFNSNKDFEKILKHSKSYVCFLDFVETKGSNFEKILYEKYNIEEEVFNDLENIKEWLSSKTIEYKIIPLTNNYIKLLDKELAVIRIKELMKNSKIDVNLSNKEIDVLLKPLMIKGKVKHQFNMKLELIYCYVA